MSTVAESPEKSLKYLCQENSFENVGPRSHILLGIALEANVPHY